MAKHKHKPRLAQWVEFVKDYPLGLLCTTQRPQRQSFHVKSLWLESAGRGGQCGRGTGDGAVLGGGGGCWCWLSEGGFCVSMPRDPLSRNPSQHEVLNSICRPRCDSMRIIHPIIYFFFSILWRLTDISWHFISVWRGQCQDESNAKTGFEHLKYLCYVICYLFCFFKVPS